MFGGWRVAPRGAKQWLEDARKARVEGLEVSLLSQPPMLAVSRAFGDHIFKDPDAIICAEPDIQVHTVTSRDSFIILACDGVGTVDIKLLRLFILRMLCESFCFLSQLWDVLSNDEAIEFVYKELRAGRSIEMATKALIAKAFYNGSHDNITAIVATFVSK